VNDGSTDGSLKILREYESKYTNIVLIDSLNGGTASARNKGIEIAQGDYIWFVDSDDWIEKDALQLLGDKLTDKVLDILCFNGKLTYEEDGRVEQDKGFVDLNLSGWEYYNKYALSKRKFHFVCVVLRLYRREFLLKNGLFFEKGISHEDNLWIPKVLYYAQSVSVIPDSLYVYRIREGSKMQTQNFKQVVDTIRVANMLSDFFIPIKNVDKHQVYREIAGEYFGAYMIENIKLFGNHDVTIKKQINWNSFKKVSIYPRHRQIYMLLSLSPHLFRIYIRLEKRIKHILHH
jgi:glycosyltransferase involved in cell wall biosynthesis